MNKKSDKPEMMLGGSRSLAWSWFFLVERVVVDILAAGFDVSVGCAKGADEWAFKAALRGDPSRLRLSCVGDRGGAGFWSGSAPLVHLRQADDLGASVSWSAGGPASLPFRARLMRRSMAALDGCSAAVFFLASPLSPGSLAVAAQAVEDRMPVFVFSCGFDGPPAPPRNCYGEWQHTPFFRSQAWFCRPMQRALFI
jgi:hypothetical protein